MLLIFSIRKNRGLPSSKILEEVDEGSWYALHLSNVVDQIKCTWMFVCREFRPFALPAHKLQLTLQEQFDVVSFLPNDHWAFEGNNKVSYRLLGNRITDVVIMSLLL
jgi:hypothetical protein